MIKEAATTTEDELIAWQEDCDLPYPPTPLTLEYRKAVQGHNGGIFLSLGYQWLDKPHRLVHNLCQHIEYDATKTADLVKALEWIRDNPSAHPANMTAVAADALRKHNQGFGS